MQRYGYGWELFTADGSRVQCPSATDEGMHSASRGEEYQPHQTGSWKSLVMLSATKTSLLSFFPSFLLNLQNAWHTSNKFLCWLCESESVPVVYNQGLHLILKLVLEIGDR